MKKIIFILITFLFVQHTNAQINRDLKRANKLFERTFYYSAIPLYEKAIKNDKTFKAVKNLADAYYFTNNFDKAAIHYKYLIKYYKSLIKETHYVRYATVLKAQGKYNNAYNLLRRYYKANNTQKLEELNRSEKYLDNIRAIGNRYTIKNLSLNTSSSEFGAIEKNGKIVFAAPKKQADNLAKRFGWTGNHYLDLYEINANEIHLGDSIAYPFSNAINTKLHESNIIFTKDGKTAYFTRNNFIKGKRKKDNKKVTHVQIFKAQFIDGSWKNITSLPFNDNSFSTEHPALSKDEKTLYFASDMVGGFGSFDLYAVSINSDGSYGTPRNLGSKINTDKKEQFPFVSDDDKLYFASNGHPSFGSLDIFVSTISNDSFSKPDNVGFPINSGHDDFSFFINSATKEGFFSSNRPEGKGGDDIYKIVEQKPLIIEDCYQFISGIITDIDTQEVLANATIKLTNKDTKKATSVQTDSNGKFSFKVACKTEYLIKASKEGYESKQKTLLLLKERKKNNDASMALKSLEQIDREFKEQLALKKKKQEALRKKLALQLDLDKKKKTEEAIDKEKDIVKDKGQIIVKTDEINFDYNLWYLRRDAKKAIDKVIGLMKKYPDMIVEIGTHSDIRGNNRYNLELSQKRANSARTYFMEQGIEPDRISAIGYGENKPIIKCKTEESCSEEQHELNRRCEFIVKKIY
ncbi:Flagellar motor protein MotB [Tenacibaculum sp. 190524A02b]|uniref:Flagellar motor protein MotB n=1 Tax=Tenacibaculum vairaonense TaxID=3137860 RepID=A0ABM9PKM4_9FLAO